MWSRPERLMQPLKISSPRPTSRGTLSPVRATVSRVVPVMLASGTTILGMVPLLFDAMFGGMAACIMGGLLVSALLTLFVLPVIYILLS